MDHEEHVLSLSDLVHDEIDDDSPSDGNATVSRSSEFDPNSFIIPLHDNYSDSDHPTHHLGSADSVEMLEREIATLLNQNSSAASAALYSAAAQQRQASLGHSGLPANQAGIAQKEQQRTRTAPSFHSLTVGHRRRTTGKNGSDESNHPATGTAPDYNFTPAPPSSRVAPTQIDELPQQAHTQPADGNIYAAEPEAMTASENSGSETKVPFKEQVIGYSQKFRGTLLGKPDLKAHGVAILEGRTTHAEDRVRRRKSSSDPGT